MALGMKSRKVDTNTTHEIDANNASPDYTEKDREYYDPEANNEKGRKKSVIASGAIGDTDDASLTVGKQLELEATNSIKYRTCSWQKVNWSCFVVHLFYTALESQKASSKTEPWCSGKHATHPIQM